jgi:uncharacterized protein (DUF2249 family)
MVELDVRELDHPLPMEMAIDAFKKLSNSEVIHIIHRRNPTPLFEILTNNGGFYHTHQSDEHTWHVYITRNAALDLEKLYV